MSPNRISEKSETRTKRGPYKSGLERQKQILEEARNLLIEEGYHNFSIRKVAKRVGISAGNLQHHFASRDGLVSAMLDHVVGVYYLRLDELKLEASSPKECLQNIVGFVTRDLQTRETTIFFPEIWSLSNHDEHINKLMEHMYEVYRKVYEEIALQMNPDLTAEQGRLIALFISATIEGHTMFIGYQKSYNYACEQVIEMIVNTAVHIIESGDIPV